MDQINENIATLVQTERWKAQDNEHEFDRRIVEYAVKNGIDPLTAITLKVHAIGQDAINSCAEGLDR